MKSIDAGKEVSVTMTAGEWRAFYILLVLASNSMPKFAKANVLVTAMASIKSTIAFEGDEMAEQLRIVKHAKL